jgi:predicted O-methyltransferase YrrM
MLYKNSTILHWHLKCQRLIKFPIETVRARLGKPYDTNWKKKFIEDAPWPRRVREKLYELPSNLFSSYTLNGEASHYLAKYARKKGVTQILECGSGVSTIIFALMTDALIVSLEENSEWQKNTCNSIQALGLKDSARVVHAPLTSDVSIGEQVVGSYDIRGKVNNLQADMLFIDGPSPNVDRLGALPALHPFIKRGATVFLDDAERNREASCIESWAENGLVQFEGYVGIGTGLAKMRVL